MVEAIHESPATNISHPTAPRRTVQGDLHQQRLISNKSLPLGMVGRKRPVSALLTDEVVHEHPALEIPRPTRLYRWETRVQITNYDKNPILVHRFFVT